MIEWLVYRAKPFGIDIHREDKCSSGYGHSLYDGLQKLILYHPDFEADVDEWGQNYYRVSPLFLVRWKDDQKV